LQTVTEKKIGFIGAGKLGCSLGKYMSNKGLKLSGYYSKTNASAQFASKFTKSRAYETSLELVESSDVIFLTVPDDSIEAAWEAASMGQNIEGKIFCHTSGVKSSLIFGGIEKLGAYPSSLHPLMAIPDKENSYPLLEKAIFTVEGQGEARELLSRIISSMGNQVFPILSNQKILYHLAAVLVSNCCVALAQMGSDLFDSIGLQRAVPGLFGLMLNNVKSVSTLGPQSALTGPVERGDSGTIEAHLNSIFGEDKEIYALLAKRLLKIAEAKNPGRDYASLKALLETVSPTRDS
jgi:predicted short-subunit dehydrogenase-like oxidoreductase (DUF2520 family)